MATPELTADAGPPKRIGAYDVIRRLAVGGMAELYLARATGIEGFEKLLVVKRMLPEFTRRSRYVTMFLDEARLAARLQHPNLVQAYDIGESDGEYFFTMEFVHGQDLREVIRAAEAADGIPLAIALNVVIATAKGLHYAHELNDGRGRPLNVVHRDVSPSNVVVSYDGHAKLLDFGVAKAESRSERTKSGTVKGKVGYMSPEQCGGEELDRRSDVFSLGIILYELTVGHRLFRRDSEFASMTAIVTDEIEPPSSRVTDYPAELERIVMRALDKYPEHRYRTAQQLQIDLEEFVRNERLSMSSVRLVAFMEELFGDELQNWRTAQAEGQSLAELLAGAGDEGDEGDELDDEDADSPSYSAALTTARHLLPTAAARPAVARNAGAESETRTKTVASAATSEPASSRLADAAQAPTVTSHAQLAATPEPAVPRRSRAWLLASVVLVAAMVVVFASGLVGGTDPAEQATETQEAPTPSAANAPTPPTRSPAKLTPNAASSADAGATALNETTTSATAPTGPPPAQTDRAGQDQRRRLAARRARRRAAEREANQKRATQKRAAEAKQAEKEEADAKAAADRERKAKEPWDPDAPTL